MSCNIPFKGQFVSKALSELEARIAMLIWADAAEASDPDYFEYMY